MLTLDHINADKKLNTVIALTFATHTLPIFEFYYPNNLGPRKALITVIKYLMGKKTKKNCWDASQINKTLLDSSNYITNPNANACYAADSASYAACITYYASFAASCSSEALGVDLGQYIHLVLLQLLPRILEYKIKKKQKFNQPEEVLEYLTEEQKDLFLFNINILV